VLGRKAKDADPTGVQEDASGPYRVVLQAVGPKKIVVIKEMRSLSRPQMDLAHAKALVDAADASPQVVLRFEDQARAEAAAAQFGRAGATAVVVEGEPVSALVAPSEGVVATSFTCPFCATVSSGSHCENCGAPRRSA
jgi:ribosomal protein L7/L12